MILFCTSCQFTTPRDSTSLPTYTFTDVFDTASILLTAEPNGFEERAKFYHNAFQKYHKLFDIYHSYDGITNLKDINDHAGKGPMVVDPQIFALLQMGQEWYSRTGGRLNLAMGTVLKLWHDARIYSLEHPDHPQIPDPLELQEAAKHIDFHQVKLDPDTCTVEILDPELRLDVGALGKGFATERIAQEARAKGWNRDLLNIGGCVRAIGSKTDQGKGWSVGIQSPEPTEEKPYLHLIELANQALVTSGSYERFFVYQGRTYSHIIDPQTLQPADRYSGLSILTERADIGDALSTALFLLDEQGGKQLLQKLNGVEVLWVYPDLHESLTPGLARFLRPFPAPQ